MQVDPESLGQHYRSLSDEAFATLRREELTETAQEIYDEEWTRRALAASEEPDVVEGGEFCEESSGEGEAHSDWLEDAECVASFVSQPGMPAAANADEARLALQIAGIPCRISTVEMPRSSRDQPVQFEYRAMVPTALMLKAISTLDKAIFNPQLEADWRIHLESLTDVELGALNPDIICAGLFDRIARLKRAYNDEVSRRFRQSSSRL